MRIRLPNSTTLGAFLAIVVACGAIFSSSYLKYGRLVDEKLRFGILETASMLYAAPDGSAQYIVL
jgi:hypothetical protein